MRMHTLLKIYSWADYILNSDGSFNIYSFSRAPTHCSYTLQKKNEFTSVPVWCCFHKLLMLPSSFNPDSKFFILGDYQWELLCNSNKQLPLLFPSARCRGYSSESLCNADVRTDWSRHLQLYRLYLSHLEHHQYCFLIGVLMSDCWRLYSAFLNLSQLRPLFCPTEGSIWR